MPSNIANKSARAKPRGGVAARTLNEHSPTLMLTQRDFGAFAEAVARPPKPAATLRKLMVWWESRRD